MLRHSRADVAISADAVPLHELVGTWALSNDDGVLDVRSDEPTTGDVPVGPALDFEYRGRCVSQVGALIGLGGQARFAAQSGIQRAGCAGNQSSWWEEVRGITRLSSGKLALIDSDLRIVETLSPAKPSNSSRPQPSVSGLPRSPFDIDRQVSLPDQARPIGDIEGTWRLAGSTYVYSDAWSVSFAGDRWAVSCDEGSIAAAGGPWLSDAAGHWAAASDGNGQPRTCLESGEIDVTSWLTRAHAAGIVGDWLVFYDGDGDRLGALKRAALESGATTTTQFPIATTQHIDDIIGSWAIEGSTSTLEVRSPRSVRPSATLSAVYRTDCGAVTGTISVLGDRLRFDGWSGNSDCFGNGNDPLPQWWTEVAEFERHPESSAIGLLGVDGRPLATLLRSDENVVDLPHLNDLPDLPALASPATDIVGTWVPESVGETNASVTFSDRGWIASDGCNTGEGTWLADAQGHWVSTGPVGNTFIWCRGMVSTYSWVSGARTVGMVGDRLTFYDATGTKLGALVRK
jgi:hypothetical protein